MMESFFWPTHHLRSSQWSLFLYSQSLAQFCVIALQVLFLHQEIDFLTQMLAFEAAEAPVIGESLCPGVEGFGIALAVVVELAKAV